LNIKSVIAFSIGPIGSAAISFVTLPFVAWFFQVTDVGRLALFQVIVGFSTMVLSFDMHQAYVREYYESKNKSELLKASLIPSTLAILVLVLVFILFSQSIAIIVFGIDSHFIGLLVLINIICSIINYFLMHLLRMQQRGVAYSLAQLIPKILFLAQIGLFLIAKLKNTFSDLLLMFTASNLAALLVFLWATRKDLSLARKSKFNLQLLKKMLYFSLPLVLGSLASWGLTAVDRIFIKTLAGLEELGVYSAATSLAGAVGILSSIFSNLWHPKVYKWAKDGVDLSKIIFVINAMTLVVCVIWALTGVFIHLVINFVPPQYANIQYIFPACLSAPLVYLLSETTVIGIGISRKSYYSTFTAISALMCNLTLNFVLTPKLGSTGAAIATAVSSFVLFIGRTEATSFLWKQLPRAKMYFTLLIYLTVSVLHVLRLFAELTPFIWGGLLLATILCSNIRQLILSAKNFNLVNK
jgi:O-antigen/teichoic acid export membrane protein